MKKPSNARQRQFTFDALEPRTLLDGDVTARVIHGNLIIRGDALDNRILIDQHRLGPNEVRITVDISSSLNGSSGPEIFTGVTGDIRVRLFDGNDRLVIEGIDVEGSIWVDAGSGDDTVLIARGSAEHGLTVLGRAGNDSINAVDLVIEESTRIDAGAGDNIIVLDRSTFEGAVAIRARDGNDSIFLNSRFEHRPWLRPGAGDNLITSEGVFANFDFRNGAQGWEAGFADYRAGDEEFFELEAGIRPLPPELNRDGTGFFIRGSNRSDDLFMYLKRRLGPEHGLKANTTYQVRVELLFASNVPTGCPGIGGSPGESVFLKAGGSVIEPVGFTDRDGNVRLNVDKGNQSSGGPAASVAGNISNGILCDDASREEELKYVSIRRTHVHEFLVRTDASAQVWLLVGTDSGFEGPTALYYQRIAARLTPVTDAAMTPPPPPPPPPGR